MKVGLISVDGHVKAPRTSYRDYVDPAFRDAFDIWAAPAQGSPDGNVRPTIGEAAQWDAAQRLTDLETQGVVAEVFFPNGVAFDEGRVDRAPDPALTRQGNMAYNRWLVEFCGHAPDRLFGQALVSFDDIDQAVRDVHWAKDHGLCGIVMPPLYPGSRFFFDPAFDPIWAAVEETDLTLSQHGGTGAPNYQPPGFAAIMTLATEHSFFSGRSMWQMMLGGVFDRFPSLRLAFVETEVWWLQPMIDQLDRRMKVGDDWTDFARMLNRTRAFTRLASEYWVTNCMAGISPFAASQVSIDQLGSNNRIATPGFAIRAEQTMFGVDYPHFESIFPATPDAVAEITSNPHVTAVDAERILFSNAATFYRIPAAPLADHVDRVGYSLTA